MTGMGERVARRKMPTVRGRLGQKTETCRMIDGAGGHLPDAARQRALSTEDPLLTKSQNKPPIHEVGVPRPSVSEGRPVRRRARDT
jgi:hypothetical protein